MSQRYTVNFHRIRSTNVMKIWTTHNIYLYIQFYVTERRRNPEVLHAIVMYRGVIIVVMLLRKFRYHTVTIGWKEKLKLFWIDAHVKMLK